MIAIMDIGGFAAMGMLGAAGLLGGLLLIREGRRRRRAFHQARQDIPVQEQHRRFYSAYRSDQVAHLLEDLARLYSVKETALRPGDRFEVELRSLSLSPADLKYEIVCSKYRRNRSNTGRVTTSYPTTVADYVCGVLSREDEAHEGITAN